MTSTPGIAARSVTAIFAPSLVRSTYVASARLIDVVPVTLLARPVVILPVADFKFQ